MGCSSLKQLPDISKWNTSNVIDMSDLFRECESLLSLPNIENWNTEKVKNMSYMFYYCIKLSKIPKISLWNTCNLEDISKMFCGCNCLISLPDISKWNFKKLKYSDLTIFNTQDKVSSSFHLERDEEESSSKNLGTQASLNNKINENNNLFQNSEDEYEDFYK